MTNFTITTDNENKIQILYHRILKYWNERDATRMGKLFSDNGDLIGFDGSHFNSKEKIEKHLSYIFTNYPTPKYVGKIRNIKFLNSESGILIAVGGLVTEDEKDIHQELNAIQTLVAVKNDKEEWKITLYQNTPATYHNRPELCEQLTEEMRLVLHQHGPAS